SAGGAPDPVFPPRASARFRVGINPVARVERSETRGTELDGCGPGFRCAQSRLLRCVTTGGLHADVYHDAQLDGAGHPRGEGWSETQQSREGTRQEGRGRSQTDL